MSILGLRAAVITLLASATLAAQASAPPPWKLVWSDEFNLRSGSAPDSKKWVFETGGNGWGNQELQYYTDRVPLNVVVQDGALAIRARREAYKGPDGVNRSFTSSRLHTLGRFTSRYGRFEARIKVPFGRGIWPAFWLLGDDFKTAGWPDCGEIDILENIGSEPSTVHGTLHGPGYSHDRAITASQTLPRRLADDFHVFAVEWEPHAIRFYVDEILYRTSTPEHLPAGSRWVFDHPFFLIVNLAVGGKWPGSPDHTTEFPQTMLVDYVRVFRRAGL